MCVCLSVLLIKRFHIAGILLIKLKIKTASRIGDFGSTAGNLLNVFFPKGNFEITQKGWVENILKVPIKGKEPEDNISLCKLIILRQNTCEM